LDQADRAAEELLRSDDLRGRGDRLTDAVRKFVLRDFAAAAEQFRQLESAPGSALDTARALALSRDVAGAMRRYQEITAAEPENAAAWLQLGMLQHNQRQTAKALASFANAERVFRLHSNIEGLTAVALQRSLALELTKNLVQSEGELRAVAAMARAVGSVYLEAQATGRLGVLAALGGRFEEARTAAETVGELSRVHGFGNLRAQSLYDLGFAHLAQFRYGDAEPWMRQSLEIAKERRMRVAAARAETGLAQALIRQAHVDEALPLLQSAEAFYRTAKYPENALKVRILRVDARINDGENAEAYEEARACLDEARRSGSVDEAISMRLRVAHMAIVRGDFPECFRVHREVRAEYARLGRDSQYLRSLLNEARVRSVAGDLAETRRLTDEAALRIRKAGADGAVEESRLHLVLANLATIAGNGPLALDELRKASKENKAVLAVHETRALLAAGRPQAALRIAEQMLPAAAGLSLAERFDMRCALAEALLGAGRRDAAIQELDAALAEGGKAAQILTRLRCLLVLRKALQSRDDPREAAISQDVGKTFAALTATWSEPERLRLKERPDWKEYFREETK
jgi:tetratricopeptide (TPR) repeat protein